MKASKLISLLLALTLVVFLSTGMAQAQEGDQSSGSIEVVCSGYFYYQPWEPGFHADIVCGNTSLSPGYWRHHFVVWHEGVPGQTGILEKRWNTDNLYDCSLYIRSFNNLPYGIKLHYEIWAIKEDVDWMREGKWMFVHGSGGNPKDWEQVKLIMEHSPYSIQDSYIKVVDLEAYNHSKLGDWTNNLVNWMESAGILSLPDGSVKVIAHSFGGAVTLFLLRATYELQFGDIDQLESDINTRCNRFWPWSWAKDACDEIGDRLHELGTNSNMVDKWIKAARKIGGVYLYHPTIRGACLVCTGQLLEEDYASMCALGTVDIKLWYPISRLMWEDCKKIVNIYGFGGNGIGCWAFMGCGWGTGAHDARVQDDHQRLFSHENGATNTQTQGAYTETFGGYACHGDFQDRYKHNAAEDLVIKIVENPTPYPYGIPLCGSVCNGNKGPLTDRCPYLVTCNVEVPSGKTLTVQPGAQIYFESGRKITAHGTLNANGELNNPIYLVSVAVPDSGIMLKTSMVLKNGGELRPGE